jgi:hypothetical protein
MLIACAKKACADSADFPRFIGGSNEIITSHTKDCTLTPNFITIGQKGKFEKIRSLGEALLVPTRCDRWLNLLDRAFGTLREHTLRGRRAFFRGYIIGRVEGISRNFSRSIVMKFVTWCPPTSPTWRGAEQHKVVHVTPTYPHAMHTLYGAPLNVLTSSGLVNPV